MKSFFSFVKKEVFHIWRDKRTLLILIGLPIVLVTLFGFAISNEIRDASITILDPSRDKMTREITNKLLSSGYFLLESEAKSIEEIENRFKKGKIKLGIAFQSDFQQNFLKDQHAQVALFADATDPNTATLLVNYATAIIRDYQMEQQQMMQIPMIIKPEVKMLYNVRLESVFMFVPGVMTVILMLVSAMMTAIAITREKELGTMEVLHVSPLQPAVIVIGKVTPYVALAFLNVLIVLGLGTFVFGMPVRGSMALLLAECMLFAITVLCLGIFISTRTDSQLIAMMISMVALMLPTVLLSGFIFPIENMPWPLQWLSHIIPAKWFLIILKNIMLKGTGIAFIWKETLILGIMTLVLIGASVKKFKIRLE